MASCGAIDPEDATDDPSIGEAPAAATVGSVTSYEAELLARTASAVGSQVTSEAAASGGKYVQLSGTPAAGAWIEFTLPGVAAGTYDVKFLFKSNSNRGIVQASIDGVNQGATCNEYASTAAFKVACSLGTKALTSGDHKIRFTVTGKSASSTGFQMVVDQISITGSVRSAGCGKPNTMMTGTKFITSGGVEREYIIDIPANYDTNKAYRLFYASHWIGSTDDAVAQGQVSNGGAANWAYYGLKRMAAANNETAIFIAPQSLGSTWTQVDHALFDDILAKTQTDLCIDTSRVFATGFSFGGMMTYSLSTNHQKVIRGAVGIAPANYNIYLPPKTHEPIAWMSTTGMSDGTTPWDAGSGRGAKYIAIEHATDNGCTIPATIPTATRGSRTHLCYDFQGCRAGFPVKACTFDGSHQAAPFDGGSGDNGLTSWIPTESWNFFAQF